MPCEDRQLTDAQRAAAFGQQRTGVTRGIRPFSGDATPENLVEYLNREVFPVLKQARDKINEVYLPVVDNAPSANPLAFYFSTETANADPTTGFIRLDNATQDTATTIRVSQENARAVDVTPWLDVMSGSVTSPLGVVTLSHAINPGRYIRFDLDSMTDQGTYWDLGVTVVESSHDNPFALNDQIAIQFIPGVGSDGATIPAGSLPALSGAVASTAGESATRFAGIRDNGAAENDRTNLNFVSATGITASVTDDSDNDELEVRYAWDGTTAFVPDGDKGHIVVSASGATWLWDNPISITGSQEIAPTGNLTLTIGADLIANATSGVFVGAAVSGSSVGTGNIEHAGSADSLWNMQSGMNITLGGTALSGPGTAVGTGVLAVNADTGISLRAGHATANNTGAGDILANATSGIHLFAGATPQTAATGIQLTSDTVVDAQPTTDLRVGAGSGFNLRAGSTTLVSADDGDGVLQATGGLALRAGTGTLGTVTGAADGTVAISASDDVTINPTDDLVLQTNSTTRARINAAGDWDFENGLDFDVTGAITADGTSTFALTTTNQQDFICGEGGTFQVRSGTTSTGNTHVLASTNTTLRVNVNAVQIEDQGFLVIDEEASSSVGVNAGQGMYWVQSTAPTRPMFTDDEDDDWGIGYSAPNVLTSNQAATNATTNLTATSFAVPANSLRAGTAYRLQAYFTYLHTAAATPTLTIELLIGGSVVESIVVTPVSSAATYPGFVEATVVCRTTGAAGTVMCTLRSVTDAGSVIGEQLEGSTTTATDTVDTTAANTIELRMRMTTAVASNTLTIVQGWTERVA